MSINQAPLHLLSTEHMPFAWNAGQGQSSRTVWFGTDSEERYNKTPHPLLQPSDVVYSFNSKGYRCKEFEPDGSSIKVVALGASEVLGTGLPENRTFPHLFAKLLEQHLEHPVINWNLGVGGSSPDYLARILVSALPVLKPDIVLLLFPFYGRREHINFDGRIHTYNRQKADGKNSLRERILEPERFMLNQANLTLSSESNDQVNLYKNYLVCEHLLEKSRTLWLFSSYQTSFFDQIAHLIDQQHWVYPGIGDLKIKFSNDLANGLARDMGHPGIGPNQEMAEIYFTRLKELYFDRLGFQ